VCLVAGTFNNWARDVGMHRSGNDFVYIAGLPRGKHAYKFIVDDDWRFAPDQATIADGSGNINNIIDLTTFAVEDDTAALAVAQARRDSLPNVPYGHALPDDDEFSKDPPLLPPHLRSIILNSASPLPTEAQALPTPPHVTINHLYCTAIKDGLMVQAITQRYRRKHATTVYYSVMPVSSSTLSPSPLPGNSLGKSLGLFAVEALASRVAQAEAAAAAANAAANALAQAAEGIVTDEREGVPV
jgi:5'-AMP-activated protein kinase regulatory beta subunit